MSFATPNDRNPFLKLTEVLGPDRSGLPSAPGAIETNHWPDNGAVAQPNGGHNPTPSFSSSTSWLAATLNDCQAWPPDTMGDVGPINVLVGLNGRIRSFDKSGNLGTLDMNSDVFFAPVMRTPPAGSADYSTDPMVKFDPISQRWFIVMIDFFYPATDTANRIMIAYSNGPTINGSTVWTETFVAAGGFWDYPSLGVDAQSLLIGGDIFTSSVGSFSGTKGVVINKASLLAGSISGSVFTLVSSASGAGPFAPRGVDNNDPTSTTSYFAGVDNAAFSQLDFARITYPGGTPTGVALTLTVPTTYFPQAVTAPGTTRKLDALDDRLYQARLFTDKASGRQTLWTTHAIGVDSTGVASTASTRRDAMRWYEVDNLASTPSLRQSGTLLRHRCQ